MEKPAKAPRRAGAGVIGFQIWGVDMAVDPMVIAAGLNAASTLAGKLIGGGSSLNADDQRKLAQNASFGSIAGKIKAAEKYGISKLYALGAPASGFSASVGGEPSLGETVASMGQDVSRAVAAGQTEPERQLQQLLLEKAGAEIEHIRAQTNSLKIRTLTEAGTPMPGLSSPMPGLIPSKSVPPQQTTGYNILGVPIRAAPFMTDAQTHEDRGGELAASVVGLMNYPADIAYSLWHRLFGMDAQRSNDKNRYINTGVRGGR